MEYPRSIYIEMSFQINLRKLFLKKAVFNIIEAIRINLSTYQER